MPELQIHIQMLKTSFGEIMNFLEDPSVVEIMLNDNQKLWVEKIGTGMIDTGIEILQSDAERIIKLMASITNTTITEEYPIVSAEIPIYGSRFEGLLPPVVRSPIFSIRQPASVIYSLDDYVNTGIMSIKQVETIRLAAQKRKNILLVGGTGSGKTTATNAVLNEISQSNHRILILEDMRELQCAAKNYNSLRTSDTMDMQRLLMSCMRLRPDRIIVGEVRNSAALDLLKAWNTGHPGGIATIHANSAYGGLIRLEQLIQEKIITPQQTLIGEAVDLIIYIERDTAITAGRRVKEVIAVNGYKNGQYILQEIN